MAKSFDQLVNRTTSLETRRKAERRTRALLSKLLRTCPMCGSKRIQKVRKSVKRTVKGVTWSVPGVTFHECPECGERLFSPEAVRRIQSYLPVPALPKSRAS